MEIFEIMTSLQQLPPPPTHPLTILSFFYHLPVKLKGNFIQQNYISDDSSSEN